MSKKFLRHSKPNFNKPKFISLIFQSKCHWSVIVIEPEPGLKSMTKRQKNCENIFSVKSRKTVKKTIISTRKLWKIRQRQKNQREETFHKSHGVLLIRCHWLKDFCAMVWSRAFFSRSCFGRQGWPYEVSSLHTYYYYSWPPVCSQRPSQIDSYTYPNLSVLLS